MISPTMAAVKAMEDERKGNGRGRARTEASKRQPGKERETEEWRAPPLHPRPSSFRRKPAFLSLKDSFCVAYSTNPGAQRPLDREEQF